MGNKKKSHGICSKPKSITNKKKILINSKNSKSIINNYHTLLKQKNIALNNNDLVLAEKIQSEINKNGGLDKYQLASKSGQKEDRGGDSSKILVKWIKDCNLDLDSNNELRLLEVGALSCKNACSVSKIFSFIERIDLNPVEKDIKKQDFMTLPVPDDKMKFHCVSLSLVLNFVPDPSTRGEMLQKISQFLQVDNENNIEDEIYPFPCLFLVLPLPCISNSRYFTESHLNKIMDSLGYKLFQKKFTKKLAYWLWKFENTPKKTIFKKKLLNQGINRNNFHVVLT